jgi:hypothetical protein
MSQLFSSPSDGNSTLFTGYIKDGFSTIQSTNKILELKFRFRSLVNEDYDTL